MSRKECSKYGREGKGDDEIKKTQRHRHRHRKREKNDADKKRSNTT